MRWALGILAFLLVTPLLLGADCSVKCRTNQDCAPGEYCLNPGSCSDSNCTKGTILEYDEMIARARTGEVLTHGLLGIRQQADGANAIVSVINGAYVIYPEDVTLTVRVDPSPGPFSVVDPRQRQGLIDSTLTVEGPLVTYRVPKVITVEDFLITFRRNLTGTDLEKITIINVSYPKKADDDYVRALEETKLALLLILSTAYNGTDTVFQLNLIPK